MNRNPQHCASCGGPIDDLENWVFDRAAGYIHETCEAAFDADRQAQPAPAKVAA